MTASSDRSILDRFATECTACRLCSHDCSMLTKTDHTPQSIAFNLLHEKLSPELTSLVQHCSLCGLCSQSCPQRLNPAELMQAARTSLISKGKIDPKDYLPMLVDHPNNFFNLYRETWDISYSDLEKENCTTLFFPGCTLSSYAPELTRAAWQWLDNKELNVGLSTQCCGLPLHSIGLNARMENYLASMQYRFKMRGVKRVVTACPNCFYFLKNRLSGIDVVSLYQLMTEAGVKIPAQHQISVHDSCPDRFNGEIGQSVRAFFPAGRINELSYYGNKTRCCGAGGIVSMISPDISAERAVQRLNEINSANADMCVSACMGCVKRLSQAKDEAHAPSQVTAKITHILELIFEKRIDQAELERRLTTMWQGEYGEQNLRRLSEVETDFDNLLLPETES